MLVDELTDGVGQQQRGVAGQHDDRGVVVHVVVVERGDPDDHGVARAPLDPLLDEGDVQVGEALVLHPLGDPVGAVADDDHRASDLEAPERAVRTCTTIGRPHTRWIGFGRSERIRVPSPAARTMAETGRPLMRSLYQR